MSQKKKVAEKAMESPTIILDELDTEPTMKKCLKEISS